jgi:hypothetical protein
MQGRCLVKSTPIAMVAATCPSLPRHYKVSKVSVVKVRVVKVRVVKVRVVKVRVVKVRVVKVSVDKVNRDNVNDLKAWGRVKPIVGNVHHVVAMPTAPVKVGRGGGNADNIANRPKKCTVGR